MTTQENQTPATTLSESTPEAQIATPATEAAVKAGAQKASKAPARKTSAQPAMQPAATPEENAPAPETDAAAAKTAETSLSVNAPREANAKSKPKSRKLKAPAAPEMPADKRTALKQEEKAVKPAKAEKAEKAPKPPKPKKIKLVRDSFAMPDTEYVQIAELKKRLGSDVKKNEILRAGIALLSGLDDEALRATMAQVARIKTGRPSK